MITIRRADDSDISALEQAFDSSWARTHADDIADQQSGAISFYVAWIDGQPVGHAFVNWTSARQPEPAAAYPDVPEIYRLAVLDAFRRRGIARSLIERCEAEARERGIRVMGLGTDPHLPEQDNLYYRMGYRDSGIGIFDDVYRSLDDGAEVREDTRFVIKEVHSA